MDTGPIAFSTVAITGLKVLYVDGKTPTAKMWVGSAAYLFLLSLLNGWNGTLTRKFAVLVLVAALMGNGYAIASKAVKK